MAIHGIESSFLSKNEILTIEYQSDHLNKAFEDKSDTHVLPSSWLKSEVSEKNSFTSHCTLDIGIKYSDTMW